MPKAASLQSNFNAGELSPLMYGRADSPRYKQGLKKCLNYIPTLQGPLARRPGTKFCTYAKTNNQAPVLIPFVFSETQAYVLEFGQKYVRFYANNGQILNSTTRFSVFGVKDWEYNFFGNRATANHGPHEPLMNSVSVAPGTPVNVQTPYNFGDLPQLRYVQNADTLYLLHPKYPVYKLQRFDQDLWDLTQVLLTDGPYLQLNSYATTGDNLNIVMNVLSVGNSAAGTPGVGKIQTGPGLTVTGAVTDPLGSGQIQITVSAAHGYTNGQLIWITGITGTVEALNYDKLTQPFNTVASWAILVNGATTFLLVGSTFVNAFISGGTVFPALWTADIQEIINAGIGTPATTDNFQRNVAIEVGGQRYFGTLSGIALNTQFQNATTAFVYLTGNGNSFFPATGNVTSWQLGVYSYGHGYPSCGTFHQDRLCLAGPTDNPQEVDGSFTSQYENFAATNPATLGVTDDNALSFQLNSTSINQIQWLSSCAQGLLAGTYQAEWSMTPSQNAEVLSPTNFNAQQTSFYGSANAECIQAGNSSIYIQRALTKVREMNFFFQVGTFRSTDLTELSEHITLPTITKLVYSKETQPLVWGLRSDGALLSMIYDRSDVSLDAGWTRHQLGGQSDSGGTPPIVLSMAVIPAPDLSFDQLWVVVQRYINGATVQCIEYMTKIYNDAMLQEDSFQLDCGATYDNPLIISSITNASPAVVTSSAHGLSNGNQIRIVNVDGLNLSTTDVNGNVTTSNLVNETTFVVAGVTTNTLQLNDFNGNPVSSTAYSAYVSGGQMRKMITQVSGLNFLELETVGVLADGSWHPDCLVNSNLITLQYPAAKVQIGYRNKSQGQLLRVEAGAADGTSIGKTRRTTRAAFMLHSCGDLSIGTDFNNLIPVEFTQSDVQQADQATPLFSGIIRDGVESAYDFDSQLCFEQSSPLPGNICAVTSFMEEFDV